MSGNDNALAGKSVMVVEDEYLIALSIAQSLAERGALVMGPYARIDDALLALDGGERPDSAVLDINVRGRPVFAIADRLLLLDIPFIFATGYDSWTIPASFSQVPRFEKPTDPLRLVDAVVEILAAHETRHEPKGVP